MNQVIPTPSQVFNDPDLFASKFFYVQDKLANRVRLYYKPAQRIYLANRTPKDLILKARQVGFSTAILAEAYRISSKRTAFMTIITDTDDHTQGFRRRLQYFHNQMPEHFRPTVKKDNDSVFIFGETASEIRIATAGSRHAGRSTTNTHIHASEVAFWPDPKAIVKGLMQAGNPAIVEESTPNGAYGYFYDLCMETLAGCDQLDNYFVDGPNGWRLFFFPWWVEPDYIAAVPPDFAPDRDPMVTVWGHTSEAELMAKHKLTPAQIMWRRGKIIELKDEFIQEYPEDPITCFLTSGSSYFGNLTHAFTIPVGGRSYDPSHQYVGGLDFGQSEDFTVCFIYDATTREYVAMYRERREKWSEMRAGVVDLCRAWHVKLLLAESNSASTNIELLQEQLGSQIVKAFETTNASKQDMMSALKEGIQNGIKLLNDPIVKQEMRQFQRHRLPGGGWRLAASTQREEGEVPHDDCVMAMGLALEASTQRPAVARVTSNPFWGG